MSSKTYSGYEEAIYYFEEYLNGWAHKYLSEEDKSRLTEFYEREGMKYCEVFDPEYIRALEIKDFLGHFMIRNVLASKTFLETVGRVMHKLVKWMNEKNYMDYEKYEAINWLSRGSRLICQWLRKFLICCAFTLCLILLKIIPKLWMISSLSLGLNPENYDLRVVLTGETLGLCSFPKKSVLYARSVGLFAPYLQKQGIP